MLCELHKSADIFSTSKKNNFIYLFQDPTLRNKQPIPAAYNRYDQERFKGKEGKLIVILLKNNN